MKIKNNGKKIVHVSNHALMPGEEITVADVVAQTPAIQILANHGILLLTKDAAKPKAPKTEAPAVTVAEITETPTENTAETEAPAEAARAKKPRSSKIAAAE